MDKIVEIISLLIMVISDIIMIISLTNEKINYKKLENYVYILIFCFLIYFNYIYVSVLIRVFIVILLIYLILRSMFKQSKLSSLITAIFIQLSLFLSEIIFVLIMLLITKNNVNNMVDSYSMSIISNLVISTISIIIIRSKIINKFYNNIIKELYFINNSKGLILAFITFFSIIILFGIVYNKISLSVNILFYILIIFSLIYILIIIFSLKSDYKYHSLQKKYELSMKNLQDYEKILNNFRISTHENKNQLITIRNMIKNNEKGIDSYIDKLVKIKIEDDEKLQFESNYIPPGGLRAVVYSKLVKMKDNKINYNLEIANSAKELDTNRLDDMTLVDTCNILSIFLDNAIEESMEVSDNEIFIEMYVEDNFVINISNVIEREIDLESITNEGYTTKKEGHGYGLSYVKKVLEKNHKIINTTSIENDLFIQSLSIKIKNLDN